MSVGAQLAMLVPTFDPSVDSVDTWSQKVEMLMVAWPKAKLDELATRLVLGCKGTAFQKLQLARGEVIKNEEKAIKRLVEIVGGTWGQVPLEHRFELAEKALYRSSQRSDETADSYLARMDVVWTEMLTKGVLLEELQSYVVLRGSKLSMEDKKRVIVESGGETSGKLDLKRVSSAIRMIGSNFFQEMTGGKKDRSLKVYDSNSFLAEEADEISEPYESFMVQDDTLDEETVEILAADHDEDAQMVIQFEEAISEAIQSDGDLAAFYSTYQEARRRLSEKVKTRGFWPIRKGFGKKGSKGGGKAFGKGKQSLAARIANSYCRRCNKKGHWKAECPLLSDSRSQSTAETVPTSFAMVEELPAELAEIPALDPTTGLGEIESESCSFVTEGCYVSNLNGDKLRLSYNLKGVCHKFAKHLKISLRQCMKDPKTEGPAFSLSRNREMTREPIKPLQCSSKSETSSSNEPQPKAMVCFASSGTVGVVDLGASQTVMGHQQLKDLLQQLPAKIRVQVRRVPCQIVFRFGNHQTLTSKHALLLPLKGQWIRIAIVEGNTPFLLSSSFLKCIKAVIDTEEGTLWSKLLGKFLHIERNTKELFLMDINQLWQLDDSRSTTETAVEATETVSALISSISREKVVTASDQVEVVKSQIPEGSSQAIDCRLLNSKQCQEGVNPKTSHKDTRCSFPCMSETQKPRDSSVKCSLTVSHHDSSSTQHVGVSAPEVLPSPEQEPDRGSVQGSDSNNDPAGTRTGSDRIRQGSQGQTVSSGVRELPALGGLVCEPLRSKSQTISSEVHPLCGTSSGIRDGSQSSSPTTSQSQVGAQESHHNGSEVDSKRVSGQQGGTRERLGGRVRDDVIPCRDDRHAGGTRTCPLRESSNEQPHGPAGDAHARDGAAPAETDGQSRGVSQVPLASELPAETFVMGDGDSEMEFLTYKRICKALIQKMMNEVEEVLKESPKDLPKRLDLVEVMCSPNSELTKQVLLQSGQARRFGLSEGDLSQANNRKELFCTLIHHRPRHLWFSPECGPWCQWSHLNQNKSIDGYHRIVSQRSAALWQISLAVVLYRIQVSQESHFHMEQPHGSLLWLHQCLDEILSHTSRCSFDLCVVGHLKDPTNALPIRKRLTVQTTSAALHSNLHGQWCPGYHTHQPIAGQIKTTEGRMNRSKFTERYPVRFARQIVKVLIHEKPWEKPVYAVDSIVDPANAHPTKKRRLGQKMSPEDITTQFQRVDWQSIMKAVDQTAPRVGIQCRSQDALCDMVQQLCPNHSIHHLVICRGTDRYVGPNQVMQPGVAPFRRRVCIRRRMEDIVVDPEWEQWERLTYRGLRRQGIPARVSLTIFASLKVPADSSSVPSESPESKRSNEDSSILQPEKRIRVDDPKESSHTQADSIQTVPSETSSYETLDNPRNIVDLVGQKHGPKFLQLDRNTQMWILKLHRNLGHPSAAKLAEACRQLNCSAEIISSLPDLKCSTCLENQRPSIPRASALKSEGDFGDSISMDGITWSNHQGHQFHFYHFLDHHTMYHTAVVSMSRTSSNAIRALNVGWMLWAGPPAILSLDAATEFTSEEFQTFIQKSNIKGKVIATEGHWQNAHIERHGQILQQILSKMDTEESIDTVEKLEAALTLATHTKNQWSRHKGFPPETLVFGKMVRVPGSVISDLQCSAHSLAESEQAEGLRFREDLAMRERARKAFCQVDNDQACRRALTHRSRPSRGCYEKGEWVMIWRKRGESNGNWQGPMQVIIQDGNQVIWVTMGNKLFRVPPEHVRPLSAVEEQSAIVKNHRDIEHSSIRPPFGGTQFHDLTSMGTNPVEHPPVNSPQEIIPIPDSDHTIPGATEPSQPSMTSQMTVSQLDQPDLEPAPHGTPVIFPASEAPNDFETPPEHSTSNEQPDGSCIPIPETPEESEADGLFVEEDCFHLSEEQCWRFEVDINQHDIDCWRRETDSHEMAFLITAAKKQRSEVQMNTLSAADQELFRQAKDKEIDSWIQTETVARILRHQIPRENVMKCRWILTWKEVDEETSKNQHQHQHPKFKPKARLVVLGYTDPNLADIPRDSPTMTKLSRMLILQLAASKAWNIESFDVKTAFLRGSEQGSRLLGLEPTPELRQKLKLKPEEILRLLKGAYGRVDAPYLWFMELRKALISLNFVQSPFDPCVFVLPNTHSGCPEGIIGVHVDDGLCCGSRYFQEQLSKLEKQFPFGSKKQGSFTFTGLKLQQSADSSITVDQTQYVKDIMPITISKERRNQVDQPITEPERQSLRGLIGSLSYAAINTRPDLGSRLSWLQSSINKAVVGTLLEANKMLHEAKLFADTSIRVQAIPLKDLRFVAFSDASFASSKTPDSHQGMIIMAAHSDIGENKSSPISPLVWHSKKIQRVAVSTLSAEAMALAGSVDILSWVRLYWAWINEITIQWKDTDKTLLRLPPAFSALPPQDADVGDSDLPTFSHENQKLLKNLPKEASGILTTDCKSLYDLISRTAPPSCQEFRTQLQAKLIKEHLETGIKIRWVPSQAQLADSLTKIMDNG